ncbi:MAG: hypothetical protein GY820_21570 [Gammaproteobacteria bacterium]|nr:hypothetical protein [Gammaproteobacteria bacterium]
MVLSFPLVSEPSDNEFPLKMAAEIENGHFGPQTAKFCHIIIFAGLNRFCSVVCQSIGNREVQAGSQTRTPQLNAKKYGGGNSRKILKSRILAPCCSSLIGRLRLRPCFHPNYPPGLQHT